MQKKLNESYGVFNGCQELAVKIADEIFEKWGKGDEVKCPIDVPCWFSADDMAHIYPTNLNLNAAYILDPRTEGRVTIFVNPKIVDKYNETRLLSSLMHELTHAYRDFLKSRIGTSEHESSKKDGYFKNFDYRFKNYDENLKLKNKFSLFIYMTNQMEFPAFIAGMYGCLANSMREIEDANDALDAIRDTIEYRNFVKIFEFAKYVSECKDMVVQMSLIQYANELTNMNFNNFSQVKRFVLNKYKRASYKIMKFIPKMIYKFFEEET